MGHALNKRPETYKIFRKKYRVSLHEIGIGNDFFLKLPKTKVTKEKINKLDFMNIKNFCA